jgi:N-acetylmuramoyl-L-alanine amidase
MPGVLAKMLPLSVLLAPSAAFAEAPRVVVIDPGHGGGRPGTKTAGGVNESAIVLAIARSARDVLEKEGVRVVMTRDEDKDVDLDERVSLANSAKASAFVSVHANWAPVPERSGAETYILSPSASDEASAELVHLENEGGGGTSEDAFGGGGGDGAGALDLILADLSRMTAHKDSALLAKVVQDHLGKVRALLPSRGLRQAPFKVLRGAKMPAVLVEVGYLSHPSQGAILATAHGQKLAGEALARGIVRFFKAVSDSP